MKKWKFLLSCILVLIFLCIPAFAASSGDGFSVSMNNKSYSVKEVAVVLDGQAIFTDVPTFIHPINDYTLVPIRFLAERYEAQVSWDQATKTAIVNHKGKEIEITIDSSNYYVDGEKKPIAANTLPKLVTFPNKDSRTMVPLRLVSEALGFEVGWDDSSKVPFINTGGNRDRRDITNISVVNGSTSSPKIKIQGTGRLDYSTILLEDPDRLVIDIENSMLNIKDDLKFQGGVGIIELASKPIEGIKVSQFSFNPDVVRVVIDLSKKVDYDIVPSDDGLCLSIIFVNRMKGIEKEVINGKEALVIYNSRKPEVKTFKLSNPERIILDLMDSSLQGESYLNYDYDLGFIEGIRLSQFAPDGLYKPDDRIVRVVLDVKEGILNPNAKIALDGNNLTIIPQADLWEVLEYEMEGDNRVLSIHANERTRYDIQYYEGRNLMEITLPAEVLDLEEGHTDIRDGLIDDIMISREGEYCKVVISFRRGIDYSLLSKEKDSKISLSFVGVEYIEPLDRIIVIDPGHGGSDPGAVQNGYQEKDINLQVSLKLNEELLNLGYNTLMTRYNDSSVNLYERAGLANGVQADLYISIHSNSIANKDISGIQVLYYPKDKAMVPKEDTLALAKIMMEEITRATGAQDKGLLARENTVVVRETSMPSVLIELGFLTNLEEANLLNDEIYQKILVESIVKGIEKYFKLY